MFILSFHFRIKDRPCRLSFSYADLLAFLFSVDKSIGSGSFFPDLDPSVNLIGHAAITEMIKLQFTTITDRIQNKIRNGNWFPKFSINRKEQTFLPICLRLLTLLTIGTGYEYDGYVFVAWVLQVRRAEVVTNDQPVSRHGPLFYGN